MVRNTSRIEHQYHQGTVLNLSFKQTHKFMLRQPFGIPPEEGARLGWPHSDHTQPGCGQLDIQYYSWKIWQEIDGLVIHLHNCQIKIFICAYAYNLWQCHCITELNQIEYVYNVTLIRSMIKATAYRVHYARIWQLFIEYRKWLQ